MRVIALPTLPKPAQGPTRLSRDVHVTIVAHLTESPTHPMMVVGGQHPRSVFDGVIPIWTGRATPPSLRLGVAIPLPGSSSTCDVHPTITLWLVTVLHRRQDQWGGG